MITLSIPLLASLLLAAPPASQVFTVDDNGPSDFNEIARAIASPLVQHGDTLIVAAGTYEGFVLDKALQILPVESERFRVEFEVTVQNVSSFSLVGADIRRSLTVTNVPGRGVIDRCEVETSGFSSQYSYYIGRTRFINCGELVVQRSYFRGGEACVDDFVLLADHAVEVENSTVVISDCVLLGGNEQGWGCRPPWMGGGPTSGSGLVASAGSLVLVTDSTIEAGWADYQDGAGRRPAIQIEDSTVDVRGNSSNLLKTTLPLLTIDLDATSTASVSGVALDPPGLPAGVAVPAPAAPFLRVTGGEVPGSFLVLDLFGPTGAPALIAISATSALLPLPMVSELLWMQPDGIFLQQRLTTAGQEVPVRRLLVLPRQPVFAGTYLTVQALVDPGASGPWLTNPFVLVLGT